jgi:hypothetical protein
MLTSSQDGILVIAHSSAAISKFGGARSMQRARRDCFLGFARRKATHHPAGANVLTRYLSQSIGLWSQGSHATFAVREKEIGDEERRTHFLLLTVVFALSPLDGIAEEKQIADVKER